MRNNTVTKHPTRFLMGSELVRQRTEEKHIPNENWESPTGITFGDINDDFYAEVWENGMDYSVNYWAVYTTLYDDPTASLLFSFSENCSINSYDNNLILVELLKALRSEVCGSRFKFELDYDKFCYFTFKESVGYGLVKVEYAHASQSPVEINVNVQLFKNTLEDYFRGKIKRPQSILDGVREARKAGLGNSKLKK